MKISGGVHTENSLMEPAPRLEAERTQGPQTPLHPGHCWPCRGTGLGALLSTSSPGVAPGHLGCFYCPFCCRWTLGSFLVFDLWTFLLETFFTPSGGGEQMWVCYSVSSSGSQGRCGSAWEDTALPRVTVPFTPPTACLVPLIHVLASTKYHLSFHFSCPVGCAAGCAEASHGFDLHFPDD